VGILTIQHVRGLAALLVAVAHNSAFLGEYRVSHIPGALGVDVFLHRQWFHYDVYHPPGAGVFLIERFSAYGPSLFVYAIVTLTGPQIFGMSGGFWPARVIMDSVITLNCHTKTVNSRWLSFPGDISHSWYLVHYPVMLLIKILYRYQRCKTEARKSFNSQLQ